MRDNQRVATAPAADPDAQWAELFQQVKDAGLLDLKPAAYYLRLAFNTLLLAAGLVAFFLIGDSWWQLPVAVYLGFCGGQSAFMWHDAGHKAMFRGRTAATLMGRIHANLVNGVSYGWWVGHHNKHHSHPNHLELDPDIGRRTIIFDISQYPARKGRQKLVVRYQHVLFFVLLTLEAYKLHKTALRALLSRSLRQPWIEATLLLAHVAIYAGCVFFLLSPVKAIVFIAVQQATLGVYFGLLFAPNHKGMDIRSGDEESLGWLERQVLTSRNIRPSALIDFVYGGLNYQIEHHLFPAMPRMNLKKVYPMVRDYCARNDIPYLEVGLVESYRQVGEFLHEVSEPVRRGTAGPLSTVA